MVLWKIQLEDTWDSPCFKVSMMEWLPGRISVTKSATKAIVVIVCGSLLSEMAYAATVKRKLRKRSVVVIDEGANAGVKQGDQVCFFDDSQTNLGCGSVRRAQPGRSFVKVERPVLRSIRKGMTATYGEGLKAGGSQKSGDKVIGFGLSGFLHLYPLYKITPPIHAEAEPPYWKGDTTPDYSSVFPQFNFLTTHLRSGGVVGELKIIPFNTLIGGRYNLSRPRLERPGLPYTPVNSRKSTAKKDCASIDNYETACTTTLKFQDASWGTWIQYLHPFMLGEDFEFALGVGLDLNVSSLSFKYSQKTDFEVNQSYALLQNNTFTLYSLGGRVVPAKLTMYVGSFGVYIETVAVIGIAPMKKSIAGSLETEDANIDQGGSPNDIENIRKEYITKYFADALDHRPGIGGSVHLGITLSL